MLDLARRALSTALPRPASPRFVRLGTTLAAFAVLAVLTTAAAASPVGDVRMALFDSRGATVGSGYLTEASADLRVRSDLTGFLTFVVVLPEGGAAFYDAFVSFDGSLMVVSEEDFEPLEVFVGRFTYATLTVTIEAGFGDDAGSDEWDALLLHEALPEADSGPVLRTPLASALRESVAPRFSILPARGDLGEDGDWGDDDDDDE